MLTGIYDEFASLSTHKFATQAHTNGIDMLMVCTRKIGHAGEAVRDVMIVDWMPGEWSDAMKKNHAGVNLVAAGAILYGARVF
jgi:hypothetical protein